jgi:hypothetical protein
MTNLCKYEISRRHECMVASFDGELIPNNNPQNLVPFIPSHRFLQLNTITRQKTFHLCGQTTNIGNARPCRVSDYPHITFDSSKSTRNSRTRHHAPLFYDTCCQVLNFHKWVPPKLSIILFLVESRANTPAEAKKFRHL